MSEASSADLSGEFGRFQRLFDGLVGETTLWLERTPPDRLEWTPPSDSGIHFGSRLRHASVKSLFVHMAVAERFWISRLRTCADGETLPLPRDMNDFHAALAGDFVQNTKRLHEETLGILGDFPAPQLTRSIQFAGDGTRWTVMGFLWGVWGHRAYHLGNLDMLVRMLAGDAPDFFSFTDKDMA